VYSAANFCNVNNNGNANNNSASNSNGVRPISEAPLFGEPIAKGKVVFGKPKRQRHLCRSFRIGLPYAQSYDDVMNEA
jgi:hypothetical protein